MLKTILLLTVIAAPAETYNWRDTLDAIRVVETGGLPNEGNGATGDNGNAIGSYQIWNIYFKDASERDKTLTSYKRCLNDKQYSERVIRSYMNRYARKELQRLLNNQGSLRDIEVISRIHNGGPKGATKPQTRKYWLKVKGQL